MEEALAIAQKTGECLHIAELYRLKGELTLQKEFKVQGSKFQVADPRPLTPDPQGEAEACFRKAIDTARQQQAKSWELRASDKPRSPMATAGQNYRSSPNVI